MEDADDNLPMDPDILESDIASNLEASGSLLEESLNFQPLEDDEEFELPHLDFMPSLEEILGQDDLETEYPDTLDGNNLTRVEDLMSKNASALEGLSLASFGSNPDTKSRGSRSRTSHRTAKSNVDRKRGEIHGTIMRHVILKGISSQLVSAGDQRINAGLPTVMAASSHIIAIGSSHGFILVFDGTQKLKCSLGGYKFGQEYGSVSSLALSIDSSFLLCGFAKGHLILFDIQNGGKLIQHVTDSHPMTNAVIHNKFTDDNSVALISDSGGSVFELNFRKTIGVFRHNSRCIFSGSRGEVCALEPLSLAQYPDHNLSSKSIVAVVTISKVIVLSLRPSVKVLFTHALTGRADTLPILAWQFVMIQTTRSEKVVDPVLAFGRQSVIYFYQLIETLGRKVNFVALQKLTLNYEILNFGWLNTRCLAIIDTAEVFHLQDAKNEEELESVDLAEVQLVYGSSFFKGLATGGNVSKAMEIGGERATYGSLSTFTNQMLLLGRQSFHVLVIRSWNERLDHMVKENRFVDALSLGCEIFQDTSKALVGLKGPKEKKKSLVGHKLLDILLDFLQISMTKNFPSEGNIHILRDYFSEIVPICVSTPMTIKRKDVLVNEVWNTFSCDPFGKAKFLESLEPFLLSDQLRNLPVPISQEFVNHYESCRKLEALEACLTHLNVTSIDIHQVMNVCWQHGLYDAIIYIYNNAMLDFVTPMEELSNLLIKGLSSQPCPSQRDIKLGNKILVYISGCLAGRAYPYGEIPSDQINNAKFDIYNCLTTLHSKQSSDTELTYPYLRALLHFDAQGLLNVISIAFEEPDFHTEMGLRRKERLVDILLDIMVKSQTLDPFTPSQVGHLFTFLARQISNGRNKELYVDRALFDQVLEILTEANDKSHHEERQQSLLDMLNSGGMQYFDREKLIILSKKVRFYRIIEFLCEDSREYDKILETFISDDEPRREQVFNFIQRILSSDTIDCEVKGQVEKSVIKEFANLMGIEARKSSSVIFYLMHSYMPLVLLNLEENPEYQFAFLKNCFEFRDLGSQPSSPQQHSHQLGDDILAEDKTFLLFINLMCQYERDRVVSYLSGKSGYDNGKVLKICREHRNQESVAFLLERDGKIREAFDILKHQLDAKLNKIHTLDKPDVPMIESGLFWAQVNSAIIVIVQLCQRSMEMLKESDRESLWFSLLDSLISKQKEIEISENLEQLKEVIKHVVSSTIGHISLRSVIDKILRNPVYESGNFGDIKAFLIEILETYHYEETLLNSSVDLMKQNLFKQFKTSKLEAGRGLNCRSLICDLCFNHLAFNGGNSLVFRCFHKYHIPCLKSASCLMISNIGEEKFYCYKCLTKKSNIPKSSISKEATSISISKANKLKPDDLDMIINQDLAGAKSYLNREKVLSENYSKNFKCNSEKFLSDDYSILDLDEILTLKLWPSLQG